MFKETMEKYKKIPLPVKASLWFFICSFMQKGISACTTPIFTRLLSTKEYGLYSVYLSWADFLSIVITFGISSSVYQKKLVELGEGKEQDRLTSALQGLATATAAVSFLLYLCFHTWINGLFGLPTELVIAIYVSVLATTAFGFWSMRQRNDYRYRKLVMMTVFTSVMKPLSGIFAIKMFPGYKVEARIFSLVAIEVIAYSYLYWKQFRAGRKFFIKKYWKYALAYVLPLLPHYISQRILSQSDIIMIKNMAGAGESGIYSLAHSLGWMMLMFVNAMDHTMAPWTYKKIKDKNYDRIQKMMVYPLLFMALVCLLFILVVPELIYIFAPPEYHQAIWILPAFIMSTFFMLLYTLFIYLEYYFEKTKYIMLATMICAVLNIFLNYICISLVGYLAAGYTSLLCYMFYAFFHYCVYKKVCRDDLHRKELYHKKAFLLITLLFMGLGFSIMIFYNNLIIRYIIAFLLVLSLILHRRKIAGILKNLEE